MGIKCWLVRGPGRGIELTQKKCLGFFYQKAEETFNPLISLHPLSKWGQFSPGMSRAGLAAAPQSRASCSVSCWVTFLENAGEPSCSPTAKPLRKLSPCQQSQDYYNSRFFSPHKTLWKNKSRPNSRFGRARLFQGGTGAEVALGTHLVAVAACKGLPHLWPASLRQAAPCPHGGGDTTSLQAAQKSF